MLDLVPDGGKVMKKVAVLAVCMVLCLSVVALAGYDKLPKGMKGFSGMLRGKVISKEKKGIVIKVEKILKLWKGNKAENPESAIGKKLLVMPRWVKGDDGKWHPYELHILFLKRIKVGETIDIEVINEEGDVLHILELSGKQRELAKHGGEKEKEKEREKEGDKGKDGPREPREKEHEKEREKEGGEKESDLPKKGVVVGEVTFLKDLSFKLKVREAARNCKKLVGETLHFFVQWIKKGGKWIPDPKEVKAFGKLRLGDTVKIDFYRDEHWRVKKMQVLKRANEKHRKELQKKQHEQEQREKKEREKKEREHDEEKGEHEKGEKHDREREEKEREHKEREKKEQEQVKKHVEKNRPKNWPKEGAIYGLVTSIGSTTLSVKVLKASDNARAMVGETVTFHVNWVKNREGKWVPDPEEVARIKALKLEDKVEIRFYFEEHYRIKKLEKD
jgi:hypothetical protein